MDFSVFKASAKPAATTTPPSSFLASFSSSRSNNTNDNNGSQDQRPSFLKQSGTTGSTSKPLSFGKSFSANFSISTENSSTEKPNDKIDNNTKSKEAVPTENGIDNNNTNATSATEGSDTTRTGSVLSSFKVSSVPFKTTMTHNRPNFMNKENVSTATSVPNETMNAGISLQPKVSFAPRTVNIPPENIPPSEKDVVTAPSADQVETEEGTETKTEQATNPPSTDGTPILPTITTTNPLSSSSMLPPAPVINRSSFPIIGQRMIGTNPRNVPSTVPPPAVALIPRSTNHGAITNTAVKANNIIVMAPPPARSTAGKTAKDRSEVPITAIIPSKENLIPPTTVISAETSPDDELLSTQPVELTKESTVTIPPPPPSPMLAKLETIETTTKEIVTKANTIERETLRLVRSLQQQSSLCVAKQVTIADAVTNLHLRVLNDIDIVYDECLSLGFMIDNEMQELEAVLLGGGGTK